MATDLHRTLTLVTYLRQYPGETVEEIASALGMTPADVRGSLDDLLLCGTPPYLTRDYISYDVNAAGQVFLRDADHLSRPMRFSPAERLAFDLALAETEALADDPATQRVIQGMRGKLLGGEAAGETSGVETVSPPDVQKEIAAALQRAIAKEVAVEIAHYSLRRDAVQQRRVAPAGLIVTDDGLYLVGSEAEDNAPAALRRYRLDRIRAVRLTEHRCDPVPAATLETFLTAPVLEVADAEASARLRVAPGAVQTLRERLPQCRIVGGEENGDVNVQAPLVSLGWFARLVLAFGEDVRVQSPPALREQVLTMAAALARTHG